MINWLVSNFVPFASSGAGARAAHLYAGPRALRDSRGIGPGADSLFSRLCEACGLARGLGSDDPEAHPPYLGDRRAVSGTLRDGCDGTSVRGSSPPVWGVGLVSGPPYPLEPFRGRGMLGWAGWRPRAGSHRPACSSPDHLASPGAVPRIALGHKTHCLFCCASQVSERVWIY